MTDLFLQANLKIELPQRTKSVECISRQTTSDSLESPTKSRRSAKLGRICTISGKVLPKRTTQKKTLILDLDETLIHSTPKSLSPSAIPVEVEAQDQFITFYVLKRPGLEDFLHEMYDYYNIYIFTTGIHEYASQILDKLDLSMYINRIYHRGDCQRINRGQYYKDIEKVEKNLEKLVYIDDAAYQIDNHSSNGILIPPFKGDPKDCELMKLSPFLIELCDFKDVRPIGPKYKNFLLEEDAMNNFKHSPMSAPVKSKDHTEDLLVFAKEVDTKLFVEEFKKKKKSSPIKKGSSKQVTNTKVRIDMHELFIVNETTTEHKLSINDDLLITPRIPFNGRIVKKQNKLDINTEEEVVEESSPENTVHNQKTNVDDYLSASPIPEFSNKKFINIKTKNFLKITI